ncbi:uncharacterized protein LOC132205717 [Neocloeon triangulifer]|uniref:uncharacterized protein LOC132205717 n=1 Tax=Neocloeon triangulifer TaxID=2078957 RepID=UPI00286EC763|nr:uncharacterized protein LOC132205717 [Neocloeon triangulifer]
MFATREFSLFLICFIQFSSNQDILLVDKCIKNCLISNENAFRTIMPTTLKQKVFNGNNCPIYEQGANKNCSNLASKKNVFSLSGLNVIFVELETSWFGAQKYCHSRGWTFGAIANASVEKEVQNVMMGKPSAADVLLWSGVNSLPFKGTAFALIETGQTFGDVKPEKDKPCLIYSGSVL